MKVCRLLGIQTLQTTSLLTPMWWNRNSWRWWCWNRATEFTNSLWKRWRTPSGWRFLKRGRSPSRPRALKVWRPCRLVLSSPRLSLQNISDHITQPRNRVINMLFLKFYKEYTGHLKNSSSLLIRRHRKMVLTSPVTRSSLNYIVCGWTRFNFTRISLWRDLNYFLHKSNDPVFAFCSVAFVVEF